MGLFRPTEVECKCCKCGWKWFTTDKEIRESKKLKREIAMAKHSDTWSFKSNKTHRENVARISQMQMAYSDPLKCPNCGSSQTEHR
ncbi:MAG: hypothetical protein IIX69_07465 [Clostridia bacterium]|nr:hypothetical protein [Clostridia bacterium]MBQ5808367.1 hypothetical protein [Clostridia bacterium]